jgi:hypothetical protein
MMPDKDDREQIVTGASSAIVRQVVKKTAILVMIVAGASLLVGDKFLVPGGWSFWGGIVFGAAIGLLNFHWLAKSVERFFLRTDQPAALTKIIAGIITFLKLSAIFVVLFIVIKWKVFHILGLVVGLSLCFIVIIWQGLTSVSRTQHQ